MSGSGKHWASYEIPGIGYPNVGWPGTMGLAASASGEHLAAHGVPGLGYTGGSRPWTMNLTTPAPNSSRPKYDELDNVRLQEALGLVQSPMGSRRPGRRLARGDGRCVRLRGALGRGQDPWARLPKTAAGQRR